MQVEQAVADAMVLFHIGEGFKSQMAKVGLELEELFVNVGRLGRDQELK